MQSLKAKNIRVKGELERRLRLSLRRLIELKDENLVWSTHPRYGADFPGRWLDTMALLHEMGLAEDDACIRQVAQELLDIQCPQGCYAPSAEYCQAVFRQQLKANDEGMDTVAPQAYTWPFSECRGITGLLTLYRMTGDNRYLDSASRSAKFARQTIDIDHWPYQCSAGSQYCIKQCLVAIIEGLVNLSSTTGDNQDLPLAQELADFLPPVDPKVGIQHAHFYFSALRGVLDLYQVTKTQRLLDYAVQQWQTVVDEHMWPTGGIPESFPNDTKADESCQCSDWIRLNLQLWRITGQAKYMDIAELALLNHYYFEQWLNGGFEYGAQLERGVRWFEMYFCCSMNGPRGLIDVAENIITHDQDTISVNFLFAVQATVPWARGRIQIDIDSEFPRRGNTRIKLSLAKTMDFTLAIRVPAGCPNAQLCVNGAAVPSTLDNGYLHCQRPWQDSDAIDLSFDMPLRLVPCKNKDNAGLIFRGPIIMALRRQPQPQAYQQVEKSLPTAFLFALKPTPSVTIGPEVYKNCLTGQHSHCYITFNTPPGANRLTGNFAMLPGPVAEEKTGQFHVYIDRQECFTSEPITPGAPVADFDVPLHPGSTVLLAAQIDDFYKIANFAWMNIKLLPAGQKLTEMQLVDTISLPIDAGSLTERHDPLPLAFAEPLDTNWDLQVDVNIITHDKQTSNQRRIPVVLVPLAQVCYDEIPQECICEGFYRHTKEFNRQASQYRIFFCNADTL